METVYGFMWFLSFLVIYIIKYVFCSLAFRVIMKNRGMRYVFLSFLPVINTGFITGFVADSINLNYKRKTHNRYILLFIPILCFLFFFLGFLCMTETGYWDRLINIVNLFFGGSLQELTGKMSVHEVIFLQIFFVVYIILRMLGLFFELRSLGVIYSEYDFRKSKVYFVFSVILVVLLHMSFAPYFFVYIIRNNESMFNRLNRINSRNYKQ